MEPLLRTTVVRNDPTVLVVVSGEVDMATEEALDNALAQAISMADGIVEVDLRDVTFFSSSGVRSLLRAHQEANERGAIEIRLVAGSHFVRSVLEITQMDDLLPLPSEAAAEPD